MFCFCLTVFNVDIHISLKLLQNFGRLNKHGWAGVASWMCICFDRKLHKNDPPYWDMR